MEAQEAESLAAAMEAVEAAEGVINSTCLWSHIANILFPVHRILGMTTKHRSWAEPISWGL